MPKKILVINLVGLTFDVLSQMPRVSRALMGTARQVRLQPPLPAVTCTSQATLTTGTPPRDHGIVSNGWYFRDSAEVRFWLRSDHLVQGEKLWETARQRDPKIRTANLFWRYCTHASCDVTVTERPTYWANGRKGPDIFTAPGDLRDELVEQLGEFPLFRFWGPATNASSTNWIAQATLHVLRHHDPHIALTYLPHLDYDLQKFGPSSDEAAKAIAEVDEIAAHLMLEARQLDYDIALLSEYGMTPVSRPVYLNRVLREAGYLSVQVAKNGELLEPGASRAFAACSHQSAHVYIYNPADVGPVTQLLKSTEGVDRVFGPDDMPHMGLDHARAGELFVLADPNAWFAYPYWLDDADAPDFARCVAIHDKPGHDPVEMFFGPGGKGKAMRRLIQNKLGLRAMMDVISLDANLIRGSHGRPPEHSGDAPIFITDWTHESAETIPMTEVKKHLLDRVFQTSAPTFGST
jgi:predicted AlkP superfamily pyrophosphatase or phosphodiesterase